MTDELPLYLHTFCVGASSFSVSEQRLKKLKLEFTSASSFSKRDVSFSKSEHESEPTGDSSFAKLLFLSVLNGAGGDVGETDEFSLPLSEDDLGVSALLEEAMLHSFS